MQALTIQSKNQSVGSTNFAECAQVAHGSRTMIGVGGESSQEVLSMWWRIAFLSRAKSFHKRFSTVAFDVVTTGDRIAALRNVAAQFLGKSKAAVVRIEVRTMILQACSAGQNEMILCNKTSRKMTDVLRWWQIPAS